ncbi:MAG TPA: TetR/AcrR family transcriptional regulator [Candidatus Dormibacteraeota bacterium]|nr:TetR/AcrR family transcriptional regulator [Candidatus Dormibacteraeota bacterium]
MPRGKPRRDRILAGAKSVLSRNDRASVAAIAAASGTSRTGFYREFESRAALLDALSLEPEPDARQRILEAAFELVGAHGLTELSMDEVAARAGVSRANLYRLFPGKQALFVGVIHAFSPLDPVRQLVAAMSEEPPEVVMPEVARTVYRVVAGPHAPRIGLLRAVFFEVSSLSPDAEAAAHELATTVFASVGAYLLKQMQAGRLRMVHPVLALQSFVGPVFFHLMTRPLAERVLGLNMEGEAAVTALAEGWLRAMKPDETTGGASE